MTPIEAVAVAEHTIEKLRLAASHNTTCSLGAKQIKVLLALLEANDVIRKPS
jgi:hypothetical protein